MVVHTTYIPLRDSVYDGTDGYYYWYDVLLMMVLVMYPVMYLLVDPPA